MIYPQCFNGAMAPFVTHEGFLYPCCQLNYGTKFKVMPTIDEKNITNPFIDPDFSLYKKTFGEIVESYKWNHLIDNLYKTKILVCWKQCSSKQSPKQSAAMQYDEKYQYKDKKLFTKDHRTIQIETSNRCSLECPYCLRISRTENLNKSDLSLEVLKDVFKYKHWEGVVDCGSFGDPIFYKYYHEMLILLNECIISNYRVSIAATGKTQKWWDKTHNLWKELKNSGTNVIIFWGIDGLEDTSKIHRKKQDWNEITTNMKVAAKNGIESHWQFIPMRFNEHQINDVRKLCEEWGVNFCFKPSSRFTKDDEMKPLNKNYYFETEVKNNVHTIVNWPKEI